MLDTMDWEQFLEWQQYAELEPFGEQQADLRMGIETSSIVNIIRMVNTAKGQAKLTKPSDFIPDYEAAVEKANAKPSGPLSPEAWQRMKNMARAMAGEPVKTRL